MQLSEETSKSVQSIYANYFQVHYSKSDFYITLGVETPTGKEPMLAVFASPEMAKTLLRILEFNLKLYEEKHRKVDEPHLVIEEERATQEKSIYQ